MKNNAILWCIICCVCLLLSSSMVCGQTATVTGKKYEGTAVFYPSHEQKKANAPFSDIVQVDKLFFLSGQIGMDHASRTLVKGGITEETNRRWKILNPIYAIALRYEALRSDKY